MSKFATGICVAIIAYIIIIPCVHYVHEGHIAVYTRGGALLEGAHESGVHLSIPFITQFHLVQITLQTDKVADIPCGTSGGVMIMFDRVEVVNRLKKDLAWQTIKNYTLNYDKTWIFDKIHHEINQFCSSHTLHEVYVTLFDALDESLEKSLQDGCNKWAPGIEIIAVRVTKPRLPPELILQYEQTEVQKTAYLLAIEQQKVNALEAETTKILKVKDAEIENTISNYTNEMKLIEERGLQEINSIDNEIKRLNDKTRTEAEHYKNTKQIEIDKARITNEYINYITYQNLKNVNKVYYGENLTDLINELQ